MFAAHVESSVSSSQFMGKMSSSMKMASTSIRLKNPDQKFASHGKYFHNLSETFGVLDRVESRLVTERAGNCGGVARGSGQRIVNYNRGY